ncbi:hypothetical protein GCM10007874_49690 [Labrys miyagiensis]|uniref:Uncharacterized protein n=1 Tax=Labrys miyagiensis TaxID=346912 RepID=A0ABQ6CQQ2_9HYPH|nr:hypothetical protein [Labrys miyagiensis]GLS21952.1 hypothetical protein GCM10007874_49690 [Labrys miyagiensis]
MTTTVGWKIFAISADMSDAQLWVVARPDLEQAILGVAGAVNSAKPDSYHYIHKPTTQATLDDLSLQPGDMVQWA